MTDENKNWYETIFQIIDGDLDEIWNGSDIESWIDDLEQLVLIRESVDTRIKECKYKIVKR